MPPGKKRARQRAEVCRKAARIAHRNAAVRRSFKTAALRSLAAATAAAQAESDSQLEAAELGHAKACAATSTAAVLPFLAVGPLPGWDEKTAGAFHAHVSEFVAANASRMQLPAAGKGAHALHVNFGVTRPQRSAFQSGFGRNKKHIGKAVLGPFEDLVHEALRSAFSLYVARLEEELTRRRLPRLGGLQALLDRAQDASALLGGLWPFCDLPLNGLEFFGLATPKCPGAGGVASSRHADTRDMPGLPVVALYPHLDPKDVVSPFRLWLGTETASESALDAWAERDVVRWQPDAPGAFILMFQPFDFHVGLGLRGPKRAFGMAWMCNRAVLGGPFPIIQDPWDAGWEDLKRRVRTRLGLSCCGYDKTVRAAAQLWRTLRKEGRADLPQVITARWAEDMLFTQ